MINQTILIIDDEIKIRQLLGRILQLEGYTIYEADSLKSGWGVLEREEILCILCDVKLPDGNGVEFTQQAKLKFPDIEIIVLTAYGTIPDGVKAIKNGAFDYITKGDDNDKIIPLVSKAIEKALLQHKIQRLEKRIDQKFSFENIIGISLALKNAVSLARRVAVTDTTVLLFCPGNPSGKFKKPKIFCSLKLQFIF